MLDATLPLKPPDPIRSVPPESVIPPVNVLAPVSVKSAAVSFTSIPAPPTVSLMTPANAPAPMVRLVCAALSRMIVPALPPAIEANCTELPENVTAPSALKFVADGIDAEEPTLNAAPALTPMLVDANAPAPPRVSVPTLTEVAPEYVDAPLKVSSPTPVLRNEPTPPSSSICPANAPVERVISVPFNPTLPAPVREPIVSAGALKAAVPSATRRVSTGICPPEARLNRAPDPTIRSTLASAPAAPTCSTPPVTDVEPAKVFTPLRTSEPAPTFSMEPEADKSAISPLKTPALSVSAVPSRFTLPVEAPFNEPSTTFEPSRFNTPSRETEDIVFKRPPL